MRGLESVLSGDYQRVAIVGRAQVYRLASQPAATTNEDTPAPTPEGGAFSR
jgi:hypothetical protein